MERKTPDGDFAELQDYRKVLDGEIEEHIKRAIYYIYYVQRFNVTAVSDAVMFIWGVNKVPNSISKILSSIKRHVEFSERQKEGEEERRELERQGKELLKEVENERD